MRLNDGPKPCMNVSVHPRLLSRILIFSSILLNLTLQFLLKISTKKPLCKYIHVFGKDRCGDPTPTFPIRCTAFIARQIFHKISGRVCGFPSCKSKYLNHFYLFKGNFIDCVLHMTLTRKDVRACMHRGLPLQARGS